jgi:RNA polymerase sigma-70 factor (ECF subfamily)
MMLAPLVNQSAEMTQQSQTAALRRREPAAIHEIPDSELLHRIARRDQQAFAMLYDRYAAMLYNFCLAILKRADDTQDVLQECFLQIWEKAHAFDGVKGSVYTWLVTMTRHRAIDRLRSKQFQLHRARQPDFDFAVVADEAPSPFEAASFAERAALIRKVFFSLPPEQREVLRLAYFEGYTQTEIAQRLRVPLGTVKTRARQGIRKLHALLTEPINLID